MEALLLSLAEVTLSTGAVILLLWLLTPLLARHYPARWRCWAWLAVSVRLLIPLNFSLPQAPVRLSPPAVHTAVPLPSQGDTAHEAAPSPSPLPSASLLGETPSIPVQSTPMSAPSPQSLLSLLWLAGMFLFLAWHLAGWLRFWAYLRRWAGPCGDPHVHEALKDAAAALKMRRVPPLLSCPGLSTPMLAGLFRPVLLLPVGPEGWDKDALPLMLRHECCHYRRHDLWFKGLLLLVNAVHWFNPLVWLMRYAADRDLEQACDQQVLQGLSQADRVRYGHLIVDAVRRTSERRFP
ncbi:M56 family metallopeptidase [Pseudoflavonifractor phocaeensis]|uniref:M56 family metallopeptidase n=1 Tax=Pseudoflavonifractor phocaeensis TaxID=1870988 RepID=UPI00195A6186|nr:M56 family metallopeptidase [Pseudoflavonifractor phocaeensis]MBM6939119.1 M56 family metallopeptidase [Pseudoflavonifractor phocaeensis]